MASHRANPQPKPNSSRSKEVEFVDDSDDNIEFTDDEEEQQEYVDHEYGYGYTSEDNEVQGGVAAVRPAEGSVDRYGYDTQPQSYAINKSQSGSRVQSPKQLTGERPLSRVTSHSVPAFESQSQASSSQLLSSSSVFEAPSSSSSSRIQRQTQTHLDDVNINQNQNQNQLDNIDVVPNNNHHNYTHLSTDDEVQRREYLETIGCSNFRTVKCKGDYTSRVYKENDTIIPLHIVTATKNAAVEIVEAVKQKKRDLVPYNALPACFGSIEYTVHTVFLQKKPEGIGMRLKKMDGHLVVRGFRPDYNQYKNADVRVNDVIAGVNYLDSFSSPADRMLELLRWKEPSLLDEASSVQDTVVTIKLARPTGDVKLERMCKEDMDKIRIQEQQRMRHMNIKRKQDKEKKRNRKRQGQEQEQEQACSPSTATTIHTEYNCDTDANADADADDNNVDMSFVNYEEREQTEISRGRRHKNHNQQQTALVTDSEELEIMIPSTNLKGKRHKISSTYISHLSSSSIKKKKSSDVVAAAGLVNLNSNGNNNNTKTTSRQQEDDVMLLKPTRSGRIRQRNSHPI